MTDQWTIYVCGRCHGVDDRPTPFACCDGHPMRAVEVVPAARLAEVEAERDRLLKAQIQRTRDFADVVAAAVARAEVAEEALRWIADVERAETADPHEWAVEAHDLARAVLASVPSTEGEVA